MAVANVSAIHASIMASMKVDAQNALEKTMTIRWNPSLLQERTTRMARQIRKRRARKEELVKQKKNQQIRWRKIALNQSLNLVLDHNSPPFFSCHISLFFVQIFLLNKTINRFHAMTCNPFIFNKKSFNRFIIVSIQLVAQYRTYYGFKVVTLSFDAH